MLKLLGQMRASYSSRNELSVLFSLHFLQLGMTMSFNLLLSSVISAHQTASANLTPTDPLVTLIMLDRAPS